MKTLGYILIGAFVAVGVFSVFKSPVSQNFGSVAVGGEYQSTTTSTGFTNYSVLQNRSTSGSCTLGSVIITGAAAGTFTIYDATSTVTNTLWPTTTIASFPTNAAVGTYTFDVACRQGILVDFKGTLGTTTITYR